MNKGHETCEKSISILLFAHTAAPGRATAGFLQDFLVCLNERDSDNADTAWLVRCANGVFRRADVRHKWLCGPFPRVEHLREACVRLKDEASAANRQRPPKNRIVYGVVYGGGV